MQNKVAIVEHSDIIGMGLHAILNSLPGIESKFIQSHTELASYLAGERDTKVIIINDELFNNADYFKVIENIKNTYVVKLIANSPLKDSQSSSSIYLNQNENEIKDLVSNFFNCEEASTTKSPSSSELTHRENDVLKLVAFGYANKEIADQLNISFHTVISHRKNITEKLGIKSISGLTVYAILNRLIDPDTIDVEKLI